MIRISNLINSITSTKAIKTTKALFSAKEISQIKQSLMQPKADILSIQKKALNPVQMSIEKFEELLAVRKGSIPHEDLREISSIFIGHRFGESSNEIINNYLRTGSLPVGHKYWNKDTIEAEVSNIRKVAKQFSLDNDYKVFRGVENLDFLPKAGEIFTEKGFMSTTSSQQVANRYSGIGPMIEIILPKGTNCNLNGNDCEILLNNGSKFKVLKKSTMYALLELLNPNS